MTRYISTADTAKLIRAQLKAKFAGVKFSVRSSVYAGGSSIRVDWIDGPTARMVDEVVKPFAGAGFDGSIDMKYNSYSYLMPDGSAVVADTSGTEGSMGSVPRFKQFKPVAEAERVSFGADYVFTERRVSRRLVEGAIASFARKFGQEMADRVSISERIDGTVYANAADYDTQIQFYRILERRVIAA